jgi:hypothetical protein
MRTAWSLLLSCTKDHVHPTCTGGYCLQGHGLIPFSRYGTPASSIFTIHWNGSNEMQVSKVATMDIRNTL